MGTQDRIGRWFEAHRGGIPRESSMIINLFDAAFAHNACSVHGKTSRHIEYVRSHLKWDGVTLITDAMLCDSRVLDHLESRVTIGWLLEPREYVPGYYAAAERLL